MAGMIDEIMAEAGLENPTTNDATATATATPDVGATESDSSVIPAVEPNSDATADGLEKQDAGKDTANAEAETKSVTAGKPGQLDEPDEPRVSKRAFKRARHEIAELRKRLAEYERRTAPAQAVEEDDTPAVVDRSAFKTDSDYVEALVRTRLDESKRASARKEREELERYEANVAATRSWAEKIKACFPTPDEQDEYDDAIVDAFDGNPGEHIGEMAGQYVFQHPKGPAILKYLATHPTTCERLRNAHPFDASDIMRRIVGYVNRATTPAETANAATSERRPVAPVGSIKTGGAAVQQSRTAEEIFSAAYNQK